MGSKESIVWSTLRRPALPRVLVERDRLTAQLSGTNGARVTSVVAPAGYGKSTLIAEWYSTAHVRSRRFAGVSLEAGDNDAGHFWRAIAQAASVLGATVGQLDDLLRAELSSAPDRVPEEFVRMLASGLEAAPKRGILVLDDLHVIEQETLVSGLEHFIARLPSTVHLVLLSRTALDGLKLHRLKVRRELHEIEWQDLAFTPDEAALFLDRFGIPDLAAHDRELLIARTAGWIAGLQLACIALQTAPSPKQYITQFAGSDRSVAQFLLHEVLALESPEMTTFLLETSILDRMCPSACDALNDGFNAAVALSRLAGDGLFLSPLDEGGSHYRYHPLFVDFLRAELQIRAPTRVPELHRRAAAWYRRAGRASEAVEHALNAGDYSAAADLIVQLVTELHRAGHDQTLRRWFSALPVDLFARRPDLALKHGWIQAYAGQPAEALRWCEQATQQANGTLTSDGEPASLRAFAYRMLGNPAAAVEWGSRSITLFDAREPDCRQHDAPARLATIDAMTEAYMLLGEPRRAMDLLQTTRDRVQEGGDVIAAVSHPGKMALLAATLGELSDVEDHAERAGRSARRLNMIATPPIADAEVALGELLWERDELAAAAQSFTRAIDAVRRSRRIWIHVRALLALATCRASQRRFDEALEILDATSSLYPWGESPPFLRAQIAERHIALRVRAGRLDDVDRWWRVLESAGSSTPGLRTWLKIGTLLAKGEPQQAYELARRDPAGAESLPVREAIRREMQLACASAATGAHDERLRALGMAVALGQPGRFVRTLLEPGADLLVASARRLAAGLDGHPTPDPQYVRVLDAAARAEQSRVFGKLPERERRTPRHEPLSGSEISIMELLPTELTYAEIAARRYVSVNTVKSQVKSVYRKLGVSSRVGAVERCRELGLVPN